MTEANRTKEKRLHVGPGMYWEETVNKDHPTSNTMNRPQPPQRFFLNAPKQKDGECYVLNFDYMELDAYCVSLLRERDRLRADLVEVQAIAHERLEELKHWRAGCTGRHGSQMPCVSGEPNSAPETSDGWRPIETAPNDGLPVLITDGAYIAEAWRRGDRWEVTCDGYVFEDACHWMPIPGLPKRPSDEGITVETLDRGSAENGNEDAAT